MGSMGPGRQNAVSVKIIPHPWQSFPVFCLPMDGEREGCTGQSDAAQLSRPALHDPPLQREMKESRGWSGQERFSLLGLPRFVNGNSCTPNSPGSGGLPHRKPPTRQPPIQGGTEGFSSGPESISRSQGSSWHENSLLGGATGKGRGSGGKGLECGDSALFSSGTRAGGALSEIARRGFRAAQGLGGRARARSGQVGLRQQCCIFPGA